VKLVRLTQSTAVQYTRRQHCHDAALPIISKLIAEGMVCFAQLALGPLASPLATTCWSQLRCADALSEPTVLRRDSFLPNRESTQRRPS
jgi:hypothetical protein